MTSINFNAGAQTALANLRSTNSALQDMQNQISTGQKVSSAKDNASSWAIAETMRGDASGFRAVGDSLGVARKAVNTATTAAETVSQQLTEIRDRVVAAQSDTSSRDDLQTEIEAISEQIGTVIEGAAQNGVNLLKGDDKVDVLTSIARGEYTVEVEDPNDATKTIDETRDGTRAITQEIGGLNLDASVATALTGDPNDANVNGIDVAAEGADFGAILSNVDDMISTTIDAAANLGATERGLEIQSDFVNKMVTNLEGGISALVDADMTEASARLKALQTQQQLGTQALSIANSASESMIQLFR